MSLSSLPVEDYESNPTFPTDIVGKRRFYTDWFSDYADQNKSNPDAVIEANKHYGDTLRGLALEEAATTHNGDAEDYINNRIKELNDPSYLSKTYKKDSDFSNLVRTSEGYYKKNERGEYGQVTPGGYDLDAANFRASIYDGHNYKTTGGAGKPVDIQTDKDFFSVAPFKSANGREMALVTYADGSKEITESSILNPRALAAFVRVDRRDKFTNPDAVSDKIRNTQADDFSSFLQQITKSAYDFSSALDLGSAKEDQDALKEVDAALANPDSFKRAGKWYNILAGQSTEDAYSFTSERHRKGMLSPGGAPAVMPPEVEEVDREKFIERLQGVRNNILNRRNKAVASYVANRNEAGQIPTPRSIADFMEATQTQQDSLSGALSYFTGKNGASNLFNVMIQAAAGSSAQSAVPIAGGILGGAAAGGLGAFAGGSAAGYNVEQSASFAQYIIDKANERGIDVSQPENIMALLSDEKILKEAEDFAGVRAGVISVTEGAASALTLGVAKAIKSTIAQAALGAGIGIGSEMAGEAGGQYASTGKVDYRDVALEGLAAGPAYGASTMAQGISAIRGRNKSKFATTPVEEVKDFTKKEVVKTTVEKQKNELLNKVGARNVTPEAMEAAPVPVVTPEPQPLYIEQASPKEAQLTDKPQLTDFPDLATQFSGEEGLLQVPEEEGDLLADYGIQQKQAGTETTSQPAQLQSGITVDPLEDKYNTDNAFKTALHTAASKLYQYGQDFATFSKNFAAYAAERGLTLSKNILNSVWNTVNNTYKYVSSFFNRHATTDEVSAAIKALQSNESTRPILQALAAGDEIREDQLTEIIKGMGLAENFKGKVYIANRGKTEAGEVLEGSLADRYQSLEFSEEGFNKLKPGDVVLSNLGINNEQRQSIPNGVAVIAPALPDRALTSKLKQQQTLGEKGIKTVNVKAIYDGLDPNLSEEEHQAALKKELDETFGEGNYIFKPDSAANSVGIEELNKEGAPIQSTLKFKDEATGKEKDFDVIAQERKDFDPNRSYRVHVFNDGKQFHIVPFGTFSRGQVNAQGKFDNNTTGVPIINQDDDADAAEEYAVAVMNNLPDKSGLIGSFLGLDVEYDRKKGEYVILEMNPSKDTGGSGLSFNPFVLDSIYSIFTGKTPIIAKLVNALNGTTKQATQKPSNLSNYIYDKFQDLMEYIGVTAHAVPRDTKRTVRINGQKVNINNLSPDTVTQLTEIQDNEKKAKRGAAVSMPAKQKQEVYNTAVKEHETAEIAKLMEKYPGVFRIKVSDDPVRYETIIPETLNRALELTNDFLANEIKDPAEGAQAEAKAVRDSMLRKQKLLFVNEQLVDQASEYFSSETFNALPEEMQQQVMAGIALATNVDMDSKESEMRRANFALDSLFNNDSPIGLAKLIHDRYHDQELENFNEVTRKLGESKSIGKYGVRGGVKPEHVLDPAIPNYLRFLPLQKLQRKVGELNSFVPHAVEINKLAPFEESQRWLWGFIGQYLYSVQQANIDSKPDLEAFEQVITSNLGRSPSIDDLVIIDIAAQLTQYDEATSDPIEALRKIRDDIAESNAETIRNNTGISIADRSFTDRQEALHNQEMFHRLMPGVDYVTMDENQIIAAIENNLTPQQRNILEAARVFGNRYHSALAYANGMAHGKALPRYRNYVKRQSSNIGGRQGLNAREKDTDSESSVLLARRGRKAGQFYRFNIASSIKNQLTETHYEINSAVHRSNLEAALDPQTPLARAMDAGKRTPIAPSRRVDEIIGNYHDSMITDPFQAGTLMRIFLRMASITTSLIFANPKNLIAQSLSPLSATIITSLTDGHFRTLNSIFARTGTQGFRDMDNWITENIPTIIERLENQDQALDDIRKFFSSERNPLAMVFKNGDFARIPEALLRTLPAIPEGALAAVSKLTRSLSTFFTAMPDVWAAKKIFLAKYIQFLEEGGIVANVSDFIDKVRVNDRSLIDPGSIQRAIAYVDQITGTPSAYASRAEAFKNKSGLAIVGSRAAFFARQSQNSLGTAIKKDLAHFARHGAYALTTGSPAHREAATSAFVGLIANLFQNVAFRATGAMFVYYSATAVYMYLKGEAEEEKDPKKRKQLEKQAEAAYNISYAVKENDFLKDGMLEAAMPFFPGSPAMYLNAPAEYLINAGIFDPLKKTGAADSWLPLISDKESEDFTKILMIQRRRLHQRISSLKKGGLSTEELEEQVQDIDYKIQHFSKIRSVKYAHLNLGEFGNTLGKAQNFIDVMSTNVITENDKIRFEKALQAFASGEITIEELNANYNLSLEEMAAESLKEDTDLHLFNIFRQYTGGMGFGPAIDLYTNARKAAQVEVEKRQLEQKRATNRGLRKAGLSPRQLREVE